MVNFNEFKDILVEHAILESEKYEAVPVYEGVLNEEEMSVVDKAMAVAKIKIWGKKLQKANVKSALEDINWEKRKEVLGAKEEGSEKAKYDKRKEIANNHKKTLEDNITNAAKGNKQLELLAAQAKDGAEEAALKTLIKNCDEDDAEKYKDRLAKLGQEMKTREDGITSLGNEIKDVSKEIEKIENRKSDKLTSIQDKIEELEEADAEGNKAAIKALEDFKTKIERIHPDDDAKLESGDEELLNKSIDDIISDKTAKKTDAEKQNNGSENGEGNNNNNGSGSGEGK